MQRTKLAILVTILFGLTAAVASAADTPGIVVDKAKRTIAIDAKVAPRKIDDPRFKEIYPIEVVACWAFPKGEKSHETVVTIDIKPSLVHKALEDLGLKAGRPAIGEDKDHPAGEGPKVNVFIEVPTEDGSTKKIAIEKILVDKKTLKPIGKVDWRFTGSCSGSPIRISLKWSTQPT